MLCYFSCRWLSRKEPSSSAVKPSHPIEEPPDMTAGLSTVFKCSFGLPSWNGNIDYSSCAFRFSSPLLELVQSQFWAIWKPTTRSGTALWTTVICTNKLLNFARSAPLQLWSSVMSKSWAIFTTVNMSLHCSILLKSCGLEATLFNWSILLRYSDCECHFALVFTNPWTAPGSWQQCYLLKDPLLIQSRHCAVHLQCKNHSFYPSPAHDTLVDWGPA